VQTRIVCISNANANRNSLYYKLKPQQTVRVTNPRKISRFVLTLPALVVLNNAPRPCCVSCCRTRGQLTNRNRNLKKYDRQTLRRSADDLYIGSDRGSLFSHCVALISCFKPSRASVRSCQASHSRRVRSAGPIPLLFSLPSLPDDFLVTRGHL
jgi:hypothetical protein